jgi:virginiamycin B lyase
VLLLALLGVGIATPPSASAAWTFHEVRHGFSPYRITYGPDGSAWFVDTGLETVSKITHAGVITDYSPPTTNSYPIGITTGRDGNLWFTELLGNNIGRITPTGVIAEFPLPSPGSEPNAITSGPDGALWFTEENGLRIGRITTDGVLTEFWGVGNAVGITSGPDGNLWFTNFQGNAIGRMSTTGVFTEFPIPTADSGPIDITSGPDGKLWFTEFQVGKIGRITTDGIVDAEFPAGVGPNGIASAKHSLIFADDNGNSIGNITLAGAVHEWALPTFRSFPSDVAIDPSHDDIWFTEDGRGVIGVAHLVGQIADEDVKMVAL